MIDRIERATLSLIDWAAAGVWRQVAMVTLLSLAVLIPGLSALPVTDRDEARFVQASKQMLETGDLIDIRFQDQPRWKKPVGIYWLQAGAASLFGAVDAPIWAYRLPSAFAAWLAAILTLWAARPLIGARGALIAGAMMATTLLMVAEGHIAKTDAALTASAAGALGGLANVFLGRGSWPAALIFWLSIAASILLKGPIVPVIAVFAVAALWWHRDTRSRMRNLHALPGIALVTIVVAPWLVAIWQVSDGKFFTEALGRDMGAKLVSGQEKHWGPPGLYLALVWFTFWPWAALIPLAAGWAVRQRRTAWSLMLLAWLVPFWLVLEAVPTKLPHYVLPLYPALVILGAGWMAAPAGPAAPWPRRIAGVLAATPPILAALGLLAGSAFITWQSSFGVARPLDRTEAPWLAALLAVLAAVIAVMAARALARQRRMAFLAAGVTTSALLYAALLQFGMPRIGYAFPSPAMAAALDTYRPCASGPAFSVGYHEPSLVFLTETGIRMADPEGAMDALADDPGAMVLLTDRWRQLLQDIPPGTPRATFHYFNYNRGKAERAVLLTSDDPRWRACEN